MRCLSGERWENSALDYHRGPADYRIQVLAFANIEKLSGAYFIPDPSARILWNYLREIGPIGVWRKVISRLQEQRRNEKFLSFGIGEVAQGPTEGRFEFGQRVLFIAPGSPACVERVVLPEVLMVSARGEELCGLSDGTLSHLPKVAEMPPMAEWWNQVRVWNSYSGHGFSEAEASAIAGGLHDLAKNTDWTKARALPASPPSEIRETRVGTSVSVRGSSRRKEGVLFGYGHYAKTNILPNVQSYIDVDKIHELDPAQISQTRGPGASWDTSPEPRIADVSDAFFIAGYHHTHAPLAVTALRQGAYAVVEKPLAVDREQLTNLLSALEEAPGRFFACFHKRYSPLNEYVLADLQHSPGKPIDYHCIVYEVPLPELHWYRWPNSKSRLISNGCHWLDHFLYLNEFGEVESMEIDQGPSGTINTCVTLRNGAYFTMVLTDKGSERIGLQDYVELRSGEATAKIINTARYLAEDRIRVVRRARVNKLVAHKLMYRTIAKKIGHGENGDSVESVRVSTQLVLDLEDRLNQVEAAA
jgi:predicted dehydrogenase